MVEPTRNSGLMIVTLSHRDQETARRLLTEIVQQYQDLHQKTHKPNVTPTQISTEKDRVKADLMEVERDLRNQKKKVNIWSLEQSKADLMSQMTTAKNEIGLTEAQLAEVRAVVDERNPAGKGTNEVAEANGKAGKGEPPAPGDVLRYNELARKLVNLRHAEAELADTFSDSSRMQKLRADIKETEEELEKIPIDPAYIAHLNPTPGSPVAPGFDWESARLKLLSLEAKYGQQTNNFMKLREQASRLDEAEDTILDLENRKKQFEEQYGYLRKEAEQLTLDQINDPSVGNIKVVQGATRISPDSKKLMKKAGSAVGGGVGVGFLLAMLLDFILKPTVKRRKDLEVGARVPVLASIPNFGRSPQRKNGKNGAALQKNGNGVHTNGDIAYWDENDPMLPYYEALRDRVVMSYDGDLHKPKIVGLTSCNKGAGVSRLATGLAAALSRDAERNILLVSLERNRVAVSAFSKGRPTDGMEAPPEEPRSDKEMLAKNLYSLATTGRNLAGASVVQSFSDLLPTLKISEYDYIIFDLPPLSQTSGSLRLASQMERAILVVEAEETQKASLKRASNLLRASRGNLFTVLNKKRSFGPQSLEPDI